MLIQPMGFIDADLKKKIQIVFFFRHYLISMHELDIITDVVKKIVLFIEENSSLSVVLPR